MSHNRIYHVPEGVPYHRENSIRGVRAAKRAGCDAIDIDMQITRDGFVVATHWGNPLARDGFVDPEGRIPEDAWVRLMTWEQVSRLYVPKGNYRILRLSAILRECARLDVEAVLEPKGDTRFELDEPWQQIERIRNRTGAQISVRAIRDLSTRNAGTRRIMASRRVMPNVPAWTI